MIDEFSRIQKCITQQEIKSTEWWLSCVIYYNELNEVHFHLCKERTAIWFEKLHFSLETYMFVLLMENTTTFT